MSQPQLIDFTDAAAQKVHSLIVDEGNDRLNLRVYITGGGCSGFQYGFTFDENIAEDDTVVTKELTDDATGETSVVNLLINAISFPYLTGAEIDYKDDLQGAHFVIRNPNAATTCGCGSSFSVE